MKLSSILRTAALAIALVATITSSNLSSVDATRIKRLPIRTPKAPCPSSAAKTAALAVTAASVGAVTVGGAAATATVAAPASAAAPLAGTVIAPVIPTDPAAAAANNGPVAMTAAPWKQVAPTTAVDPSAATGATGTALPATLVPGPIVPATPTATKVPAETTTTAPTTTTPTTSPATEAPPATSTGKVTVIPIGNNLVTVGFKDGASALTDGQIVTATVSLNAANRANPPPSVELVLPVGLLCARTTFVFNAKDASTFEQQVTCRTDAGSTAASGLGLGRVTDLTLGFRFPDAQPPRTPQQQIIKRTVIPAARCQLHGDPHVLTLDTRAYDFMEQGVFRMFKSRSLQVQAFLENCDPKIKTKTVTCTRGVAISFGSSVARLFVADGRLQVAKGTASAADWLAIERLGGNTEAYRVFINTDHAAFVDVTLQAWAANPYIDVTLQASALVRASEAEGGVSGLCGNWNGNPSDDAVKTDDVVAMHATSTSQNLFTCLNDACAALTSTATSHDEMAKTIRDVAATTALHQSYTAVSSDAVPLRAFDTTRVAAFAAVAVPARKLRREAEDVHAAAASAVVTLEAAKDVCERVLIKGIPQCAKYVSETSQRQYVDSVCAADAVALGDLAAMVDSAKLSYLRECRREIDTRLTGVAAVTTVTTTTSDRSADAVADVVADAGAGADAATAALETDRSALFFGDLSQCASSCSGRGECLASGCKCARGFSGLACEIEV